MDVITLKNEKEFACVSYIVNDMMIDAGTIPKQEIKKLILTHAHYDHIIYANLIKEKYGCKIYASKKCAEHLSKSDDVVNLLSKHKLPKVEVDIILKDSDIIEGFKIIETPGHSDGSICLWNEKEKIIFTGDTLFHGGYGRTDLPTGNNRKLFESLELIKGFHPHQIYPGH